MQNICIVTSARPNIMKAAPLIWAIRKAKSEGKSIDYKLIYAGTENDPDLEETLFKDLDINRPDVYLGVKDSNLTAVSAGVMNRFEDYLNKSNCDTVILLDNLAATMSVAIVTKKKGIKLASAVAGTRTFNMKSPKEINRFVIDGLSDMLFTTGASSSVVAAKGGDETSSVYFVGNILIDTLRMSDKKIRKPDVFDKYELKEKEYIVLTVNRKDITSDSNKLHEIITALTKATDKGVKVVAPLRKDSSGTMEILASCNSNFHIIPPLTYLEFGYLTKHAKGIITDSDHIADEATFNGVPCASLGDYTEHYETVTHGTNVLIGTDYEKLSEAVGNMMEGNWKPYSLPEMWDGRTAERIIRIITEQN